MTALSVFFIPAILVCLFRRPVHLLGLLVFASVFEAGSIYNSSSQSFEFGISPFYVIEIFICLRFVFLLFGKTKLLPQAASRVRGLTILVLCFWAWSVSSAFIMPYLFSGTLVSTPRAGMDSEFLPLQWSLSNLAQAMYLTLNTATLLYALHTVQTEQDLKSLMNALYWAVAAVTMIGFAQFCAAMLGLDFPYELFNNNVGYALGTDQDIGQIRRVNSTFTEPSTAGSYFAALSSGLLASYLSGRRGMTWLVAVVAVMSALLLTTATTGLAALAIALPVVIWYYIHLGGRHQPPQKSWSALRTWSTVIIILGSLFAMLMFVPDLSDVVMAMTVEKGESYSFWTRLASDFHALEIFVETWGLGVGMGSTRSSGLLLTLLASVGVVGISLFAVIVYKIIALFPGNSAIADLHLIYWALLTLGVSHALAVPDVNRPVLWALLILVTVHLNKSKDAPVPVLSQKGRTRAMPAPTRMRRVAPAT